IKWAALISADDIQDEVQRIRLRLTENLSSIGKYNAHYNKEIRWDGTSLAALAAIAAVHPDKVGWKLQAAHIRDLASKMVTATAGGLGQKPYAATRKEFDDVTRLLDGAPVAGLPAAIPIVPFTTVVKRQSLMHALEEGTDYLKANFQNPGPFQKAGKEITRKTLILSAFCTILSTKGYPGAHDPEYQEFLSLLKNANLTMANAARNQDFATFTKAKEKTAKYCAGCHAIYAAGAE
ncbi:MAG: hypothetical protein JWM11_618, partial [Planctomycetaceae bacterium]|nr:hypothetical protein [Planctomycetaceae bacterium]